MFDNLVEKLKANPKRIVYTEGTDARILESAARLKKDGFLTPVLLGNVEDVKAAAAKGGFDIEGLEIIDPENYDGMDAMVCSAARPIPPPTPCVPRCSWSRRSPAAIRSAPPSS